MPSPIPSCSMHGRPPVCIPFAALLLQKEPALTIPAPSLPVFVFPDAEIDVVQLCHVQILHHALRTTSRSKQVNISSTLCYAHHLGATYSQVLGQHKARHQPCKDPDGQELILRSSHRKCSFQAICTRKKPPEPGVRAREEGICWLNKASLPLLPLLSGHTR